MLIKDVIKQTFSSKSGPSVFEKNLNLPFLLFYTMYSRVFFFVFFFYNFSVLNRTGTLQVTGKNSYPISIY